MGGSNYVYLDNLSLLSWNHQIKPLGNFLGKTSKRGEWSTAVFLLKWPHQSCSITQSHAYDTMTFKVPLVQVFEPAGRTDLFQR